MTTSHHTFNVSTCKYKLFNSRSINKNQLNVRICMFIIEATKIEYPNINTLHTLHIVNEAEQQH